MGKRERSGAPRHGVRLPPPLIIAAVIVSAIGLAALACQPDPAGTPALTPAPKIIASLPTPVDVEANAADRRLEVSWRPVEGATGYIVAARLANGVEPFEWSEYEAAAPPYAIADSWAAMSGLRYEVRTASANREGRSEWSPPVTALAPELRPAPPNAIGVETAEPYAVGDWMEVSLAGQRPFTRRSPFVWSLCAADGTHCELLPIVQPSTYSYLISEAARGKRVQVQADYDKDGASYTATATLGVVSADAPGPALARPALPKGCLRIAPSSGAGAFARDPDLATHLHLLESRSVQIEWDSAAGGAVETLCDRLLAATPLGRFVLVDPAGRVEMLDGRVPMNLEGFQGPSDNFRVADVLLIQRSEEIWEMFVTHHYFTGDCVAFRLSSTTLARNEASFSMAPEWRTIFDAEPCLPTGERDAGNAGGKMLTDGPNHLLIVIGDQGRHDFPQDPDSHYGKLVRVAIDSGQTEVLSSGFRNPQGFARDSEGNLWQTEHGPKGGDELNLLESGMNYGWPTASYGVHYTGETMTRDNDAIGAHEGYVKPRFAWVPSIAISSIIVNDRRWFPLWKDDLLIASLTGALETGGSESRGRALYRVRRDGTNIRYFERIEVGYRIRDLAQMPDGRIALLADDGRVHFLSRSLVGCDARADELARRRGDARPIYYAGCGAYASDAFGGARTGEAEGTPAQDAAATPNGAALYAANCSSCHSLSAEEHGVGPHLVGVIGRPIGQVDGWSASDALRSVRGAWTADSLAQFLASPQSFAPGNSKGSLGIAEAEARAIADYVADASVE